MWNTHMKMSLQSAESEGNRARKIRKKQHRIILIVTENVLL